MMMGNKLINHRVHRDMQTANHRVHRGVIKQPSVLLPQCSLWLLKKNS